MERLTVMTEPGRYALAEGTEVQAAVDKLGRLETLRQKLEGEAAALEAELEPLRAQGLTKSYRFKEKTARKFTIRQVLEALREADEAGK